MLAVLRYLLHSIHSSSPRGQYNYSGGSGVTCTHLVSGAGGGAGEGGFGDSGRDGCGGNAVFVHTISDGFAKGDQLIKRKVERGRIGDWRV